ncbi:MAG: sensor domain-containing diguanylate cyclase [Gammaproteobacteria bacterium]|nr:sensor domain-containing diguanylate cyclase [Gammaproteobacteria bacterium]
MNINDKILNRIFMITERMIVFDGLDDVLSHIAKTAIALTQAEAATLRVFDLATGTLNIIQSHGLTEGFKEQPAIHIGEGITGTVVMTGQPYFTTDALQDSLCKNADVAQMEGIHALLCVPMKTRNGTLGCITVYRRTTDPFREHDLLLLSIFSSEAVEAIEKARLLDELKKQATLDPLTGLLNKRALLDDLAVELDRSARHATSLALLFVDLDGFKQFNDTHGHILGDKLLHDFTQLLRAHCRKIDHIGRFGGDEFVVIAPQTNEQGASSLAEKLRQALANHSFLTSAAISSYRTTCSIGVAICEPGVTKSAEQFLREADDAMYVSKRAGKNRATLKQP